MSQVIHKKFSAKNTVLNITEEKKLPINDNGHKIEALIKNFNIFVFPRMISLLKKELYRYNSIWF